MKQLLLLQQIDLVQWFVDLLIIMMAISTIISILGKFSDIIGKPFKWVKKKNEDHELLLNLSKRFTKLEDKHKTDMEISDNNDKEIKECLDNFIKESSERNEKVRKELSESVNEIKESVKKIYSDNISYRDKSREIRSGMDKKIQNVDNKIQKVIDTYTDRDNLIKAIAEGNKELLGDKIDQKFEKYVKLHGIPSNEVDEFNSLCQAYFALNGNHNRKTKYDHVKKRMKVIPVETNLILDE